MKLTHGLSTEHARSAGTGPSTKHSLGRVPAIQTSKPGFEPSVSAHHQHPPRPQEDKQRYRPRTQNGTNHPWHRSQLVRIGTHHRGRRTRPVRQLRTAKPGAFRKPWGTSARPVLQRSGTQSNPPVAHPKRLPAACASTSAIWRLHFRPRAQRAPARRPVRSGRPRHTGTQKRHRHRPIRASAERAKTRNSTEAKRMLAWLMPSTTHTRNLVVQMKKHKRPFKDCLAACIPGTPRRSGRFPHRPS
jgi:hypothetical protein